MGKKKDKQQVINGLTPRLRTVYDALLAHSHSTATTQELASATGMTTSQVAAALYELRPRGLVESVPSGTRSGYIHTILAEGARPQKQSSLRTVKRAKPKKQEVCVASFAERLDEAMEALDAAVRGVQDMMVEAKAAAQTMESLKAHFDNS